MVPKILSGSTNGKPINIAATTSGGASAVHTAVAGTSAYDEVTLYAANTDTVPRKLYLLIGGTATANTIICTIPASDGLYLVLDRHMLNNAVTVTAYAETTAVINITGRVAQGVL